MSRQPLTVRRGWPSRSASWEGWTWTQPRAIIEQVKSIITGRNHCSADEAFTILVTMSQRRNEKLSKLAQDDVDRTTHHE